MKFTIYSSINDNGFYAVSKALCLQPEKVLGLLIYSQTPSEDNLEQQWFDSLTELTGEYGAELSKYQGVILITTHTNNVYDLQLTFFTIRGPLDHLTFITSLIGDVPAAWINSQPKGCTSVADFHELVEDDYTAWATSYLGIGDAIADMIQEGYQRLISLNTNALDRQQKAHEAEKTVVQSLIDSYRQKDS